MKRKLYTTLLLVLLTAVGFAGPADIEVKGKIYEDNEVLRGVEISVNMAHTQYRNYQSKTGEFDFHLPFGYDYYIHFSKPGYVTKKILVKADKIVKSMVPADQMFKSWKVRLFKSEKGKDYTDFDDVIGEVYFNFKQGEFDWSVNDDVTISEIDLDTQKIQREKVETVLNGLNQRKVKEAKVTGSRAYQVMSKGGKFNSELLLGKPMMDFSEGDKVAGRVLHIEERKEGNKSIEIRTIELDGRTTEYKRAKHDWGGEYFFRNGKMTNAHIYYIEACRSLRVN